MERCRVACTASLLILLAACTQAHAAGSKNPKANYFLRQAEQATLREDDGGVLESVRQALENDPKLARAYALRAKSFCHRRRYDKAITDSDRAISLDPNEALAYLVRGKAGYLGGEIPNEKVMEDLLHAVKLEPNIEDGYFYLGIMYTVRKEYVKSADMLTKAAKLNPKDKNVYQYRSACYQLMGKPELALKDLDTILKMDPARADVYATRADTYQRLGQYDKAIADYGTAIKTKPHEYTLLMMRASLYIKIGKHKEAIKDYTDAIAINPIDEDLFLRRGNEYLELKDYPRALADFNESISLAPEYENAYRRRSTVYGITGKKDLATKDRLRADELKRRPAEKKI